MHADVYTDELPLGPVIKRGMRLVNPEHRGERAPCDFRRDRETEWARDNRDVRGDVPLANDVEAR